MSCGNAIRRPAIGGVNPDAEGTVICAVHGILTGTQEASWCDAFDAYAWKQDPSARVLRKEYMAGPLPIWNCCYRNPRLARSLVAEVEQFLARGCSRVCFVGHSNGCEVALRAARILIDNKVPVFSMVLIAGACESDVLRSGVFDWVSDGFLYRATAVSSRADAVLASRLIWPYGRLGYTGWRLNGREFSDHSGAISTTWHDGGHNRLLSPNNRETTFAWIWQQLVTA
jgi:hypothetical protein